MDAIATVGVSAALLARLAVAERDLMEPKRTPTARHARSLGPNVERFAGASAADVERARPALREVLGHVRISHGETRSTLRSRPASIAYCSM